MMRNSYVAFIILDEPSYGQQKQVVFFRLERIIRL